MTPLGVFEVFERIIPRAAARLEYHYVLVDYLCRVDRAGNCGPPTTPSGASGCAGRIWPHAGSRRARWR